MSSHPGRALSGALVLLLATKRAGSAQQPPAHEEIAIELQGGTAWSAPTPLIIRMVGEPTVRFRARYSTRPLADAPYYAYRLSRGSRTHAAEVELVHHKLYLENPIPPVERFEVTHGYNLAMANVRAPAGRWQARVGFGLVVAHAEGRIAGATIGRRRTLLGGGYHIAGATTQLAVGRPYPLGRGATTAFVAPELKLTASMARIPLDVGSVLVPNVAAHALAGLGVRRRW